MASVSDLGKETASAPSLFNCRKVAWIGRKQKEISSGCKGASRWIKAVDLCMVHVNHWFHHGTCYYGPQPFWLHAIRRYIYIYILDLDLCWGWDMHQRLGKAVVGEEQVSIIFCNLVNCCLWRWNNRLKCQQSGKVFCSIFAGLS